MFDDIKRSGSQQTLTDAATVAQRTAAAGLTAYGGTLLDNRSETLRERYSSAKKRGLRFGAFGLLFENNATLEIVEHVRLTPLPGVRSLFRGIANHRGNIVPVYDIYELLDEDPPAWERNRIIIVNAGKEAIGFYLYELPVPVAPVVQLREDSFNQLPPVLARHARTVYRVDGVLWVIPQAEAFFAALREFSVYSDDAEESMESA